MLAPECCWSLTGIDSCQGHSLTGGWGMSCGAMLTHCSTIKSWVAIPSIFWLMVLTSVFMLETVTGLFPWLVADAGGTYVLDLDSSASRPFPLSGPIVRAFAWDCSQAMLLLLLLPGAIAASWSSVLRWSLAIPEGLLKLVSVSPQTSCLLWTEAVSLTLWVGGPLSSIPRPVCLIFLDHDMSDHNPSNYLAHRMSLNTKKCK